jgi:hypothetical protein
MRYAFRVRRALCSLILAGCNLLDAVDPADPPIVTPVACDDPPADADPSQLAALNRTNVARTAAGSPCVTLVAALNSSAYLHCRYYTSNAGDDACLPSPHAEVAGCTDFVAKSFGAREVQAGYRGLPAFEDMAFGVGGAAAVQLWLDSVWHRTPVLSPWVRDIGAGETLGCTTMDFGVGAGGPADAVVTWPYAGQTDVPRGFDGDRELPQPPVPPKGWPSGYPITIFTAANLSEHTLTVAGDTQPIPHQWIAPGSAASLGLLDRDYMMYADEPLRADTTYAVHVAGPGGAIDWTFTTGR